MNSLFQRRIVFQLVKEDIKLLQALQSFICEVINLATEFVIQFYSLLLKWRIWVLGKTNFLSKLIKELGYRIMKRSNMSYFFKYIAKFFIKKENFFLKKSVLTCCRELVNPG